MKDKIFSRSKCSSVYVKGKLVDAKCSVNGKKLNKKDSMEFVKQSDRAKD